MTIIDVSNLFVKMEDNDQFAVTFQSPAEIDVQDKSSYNVYTVKPDGCDCMYFRDNAVCRHIEFVDEQFLGACGRPFTYLLDEEEDDNE